jgi:hemerythrin-like metal-binding protein
MEPYLWQDKLNTGIPEIDEQHRRFFAILNRLQAAFGSFAERGVLMDTFTELIEYLRVHFDTEEALLERCAYPDLERHRELHAVFTREVTDLFKAYLRDRADITRTTLGFLQDWLAHHIMNEDMKYKGYLADSKS